jgi:hypothetical protein
MSLHGIAVATAEGGVLHAGRGVAGLDVLDARAQALDPVAHIQITKLAGHRTADRQVEQRLGRRIPGEDRVAAVDHHHRRRQRVQRP